jgi:hypothetical protein
MFANNGVKTLSPAGAIKPTGTWDVAARAEDFRLQAGMRGFDPTTDTPFSATKRGFDNPSST